jgi:hypothetical protein
MEILFVIVPVLIVLGIVGAVIASGLTSKCPACGKWWGLVQTERKEISREPGVKMVKRKEQHKDSKGHITQIERDVQVRTMRFTYDGAFRCKQCSHELKKIWEEVKETW